MNERIKQLSLQASNSIPDDVSAEHAMYLFQKKFAELIVRECAQVIKDCEKYGHDKPLEFEVMEHFGVEEK